MLDDRRGQWQERSAPGLFASIGGLDKLLIQQIARKAVSPSVGRPVALWGAPRDPGTQERAEAVMQYLIQKGIDASRLTAHGYGPDRPISHPPEGRIGNRRIEFVVVQLRPRE